MENLLKIHDLPKKRAELLGEACLKLIKKYSQENQLLTDEFDTAQNPVEKFNEVKYVSHSTHRGVHDTLQDKNIHEIYFSDLT